jgi:hypothetical protein
VGVGTYTHDIETKTRSVTGTLTYLSPELLESYKN